MAQFKGSVNDEEVCDFDYALMQEADFHLHEVQLSQQAQDAQDEQARAEGDCFGAAPATLTCSVTAAKEARQAYCQERTVIIRGNRDARLSASSRAATSGAAASLANVLEIDGGS